MSCDIERNQYIIEGCANGVKTDIRVTYNINKPEIQTYEYTTDYVTFSSVRPLGRTPGECGATIFDYEKLVLCETSTGNKVLVESWTDTSDPLQARTTRYTYLATNLPFTGNPDTALSDCGSEQLDIQTKQYCDGGETVFGTLVFDVSGASAVLIGIVFHKINGSVHTPVSPVEGACVVTTPGVIDGYGGLGNGTYSSVSPVSEVQITYDTYENGYIPNASKITASITGAMIGTKVVNVIPNTTRTVKLATNDIASVTITGAINATVEVVFIK